FHVTQYLRQRSALNGKRKYAVNELCTSYSAGLLVPGVSVNDDNMHPKSH
ncbi:hypothetical protein RB213_000040, partial [Colletotrichum asianum]